MAQQDLEALGLSTRTAAALVGGGITTQKKLESTSDDKLKSIKGLGPKALDEIKRVLSNPTEAASPANDASTKAKDFETEETAKAGKRSAKAQRENAAKAEKEARKQDEPDETTQIKRGPVPVPRPRHERHGKKYRNAAKQIDRSKEYPLDEAVRLAVAASTVKFDATVELHVKLNVDPKQSDQNIRETVSLPHGTGKTLRVAVFAPSDAQAKAREAGADFVGESELLDKLGKEDVDFDVLIATPELMSQLGRFAKLLGPKGLMPNPKSGTVTKNVAAAVKAAKAGRVEFRIDKQAIVHVGIGKVSFGPEKLVDNARTVLDALKNAKPSSVKTQYVSSIYLTTTMGPSVAVETAALTSSA